MTNRRSLKLARKILLSFLRDHLAEEVLGDLEEKFYSTVKRRSVFWATLNYWYQVLNYIRPFAIRKSKQVYLNPYDMYQSYFRVGWRNLIRNKVYSFLNIGGLALGMTVAILIGLWMYDELSFNKYFDNYDRIGHVMVHNGQGTYASNPIPLAGELRSSFGADLQYVVVSTWTQEYSIAYGDRKFLQPGSFMQTDAPQMLALEMVDGVRDALKDPHSILLSESVALKLFGDDDPLEKIVKVKNMVDLKVGGVYKDFPDNTEFDNLSFIGSWDFLVSWMTWMKEQENRWDDNSYKIYVQLTARADFEDVSAKIKDLKLKHLNEENAARKPELFVHPMSRWHLYSKFENRKIIVSEKLEFIWLYGIIGVFVLLIACINFMNLSTARSEKRAKEVGIRKTMGSFRNQLISQFFSESLLTASFALAIAILLVQLMLPWFNEVAGKEIAILWVNPFFWLAVTSFMVVTGLLAGSYPALYLSSFQPVKVLKGTFRASRYASAPRKILVIFQFTVSVVLILGTIVVYQQIQFAKDRPVGYSREGLMAVYMITPDLFQHYEVIRNELLASGVVAYVATSSAPVTEIWANNSGFDWEGKDPDLQTNFVTSQVTHDYGKTIGWQFNEGRDFSTQFSSDSTAMVVNEAAVKYMGLKNPVDQTVRWNEKRFHIIGVIEDMVMGSPFEPVQPTIFYIDYNNIMTINIKINPAVITSHAVKKVSEVFQKYNPSVPFQFAFVDDQYAKKFRSEERIGKLASVFATLAILISCLGLFGLASFVAEQRTKEIGIRKVVGASVFNLWRMLSTNFVVLVIVSFFISFPMAYYFLSNWLLKYEYRIEISLWVFAATGVGAVVITLITVSFQAVRAALMNPVKSLRSE